MLKFDIEVGEKNVTTLKCHPSKNSKIRVYYPLLMTFCIKLIVFAPQVIAANYKPEYPHFFSI